MNAFIIWFPRYGILTAEEKIKSGKNISITIDGIGISTNIIPEFPDSLPHEITVEMSI